MINQLLQGVFLEAGYAYPLKTAELFKNRRDTDFCLRVLISLFSYTILTPSVLIPYYSAVHPFSAALLSWVHLGQDYLYLSAQEQHYILQRC